VQIVDALATYRLTRFVTADEITEEPRARLVAYLEDEGLDGLAYLVRCPWCVSVWISAGVIAARTFTPRWWEPGARLLALAAVAALVAHGEQQLSRIANAAEAWEESRD
jgi:hypothetical protein